MRKHIFVLIGGIIIIVVGIYLAYFYIGNTNNLALEGNKLPEKIEDAALNDVLKPQNNEEEEKAVSKSADEIVDSFNENKTKQGDPELEKITQDNKLEPLNIVDKLVSWGFSNSSKRNIDTVVVHSSYNSLGGDEYDIDAIVDIYKQYGVAAHYIIGRDGTAYRLVQDEDIAYHAGTSKMPDGRTNVNAFSIGVEMVNNKTDEYTEKQYQALAQLIESLDEKHEINHVVGHDEIAPNRKTDPWNFNWDTFNELRNGN